MSQDTCIMVVFTGTFKRTSERNYENFLKKIGLPLLVRKAASALTPTLIITESNGHWKIVTSTTLKTFETEFEVGKTVKTTTRSGKEINTTFSLEGNQLITRHVPVEAGQMEVKVIREFSEEGISVRCICDDVTSVAFFTRQP